MLRSVLVIASGSGSSRCQQVQHLPIHPIKLSPRPGRPLSHNPFKMTVPTSVAFALVLVSSLGFSPSSTHRSRRIASTASDLQAAKKIFIDGEAGTTGLQVRDRLAKRDDLEILSIADDLRKDVAERKRLINEADCVILCLPDAASIEV